MNDIEDTTSKSDKLIIKGLLSLMDGAVCEYVELIDYSDDEYDNFIARVNGKRFKISVERL